MDTPQNKNPNTTSVECLNCTFISKNFLLTDKTNKCPSCGSLFSLQKTIDNFIPTTLNPSSSTNSNAARLNKWLDGDSHTSSPSKTSTATGSTKNNAPNTNPQNQKQPQSIDLLFTEALHDIGTIDDYFSEITTSAALSDSEKNRLELLFNIARESFVDQSLEKKLEAKTIASEDRKLATSVTASKHLQSALNQMNAQVFSYKNAKPKKITTQETPPLPVASSLKRISALLIDLSIILLTGAIFGYLWSRFENPELTNYALQADPLFTKIGLPFLLQNISVTTIITFLLYPVVSHNFFEDSFGAYFTNLKLLQVNQRDPSTLGQYSVRHYLSLLTTPLSLLGFFPSLLKGRSLADIWSNTRLCSIKPVEEMS